MFLHSTCVIQKPSPLNLFLQLVLLFISSSSPFPCFSSLKSGLVVPKQADMKLSNAQGSTLAFCNTPPTADTIHSKRWNNSTFRADSKRPIILPQFMEPRWLKTIDFESTFAERNGTLLVSGIHQNNFWQNLSGSSLNTFLRHIEYSAHTAVKRGARAQFPQNFRLTKS